MSFAEEIKARIARLKARRAEHKRCWPCEMDCCYLVKEVTPYDKQICVCCRNYHVR